METRLCVAVLFGGRSGEHEVSLRSAASVTATLARHHDVRPILIDHQGRWLLQPSGTAQPTGGTAVFVVPGSHDRGRLRRLADASVAAEPDVYFPLVHGTFGEDGTLQGLLELVGLPYVGAGVLGSAAGMDKAAMKALFTHAGLPLGPYRVLRGRDALAEQDALAALGLPVFVKPANMGSSVGISKVCTQEEFSAALGKALDYDHKLVVERAIDAREIEVSVLGGEDPEVSVPGEVVPDREFYDYDSKYAAKSATRLLIPAALDSPLMERARALARQAFLAIDGYGFARVDLFLERGSARLLVNEINTIPGFTSISMFPKLWEASGLSSVELVARLVQLAIERHARRSSLRTEQQP
jgi:D-alanine-D-alanine ligase